MDNDLMGPVRAVFFAALALAVIAIGVVLANREDEADQDRITQDYRCALNEDC